MRRREFITLLGGTAAAWPFAARAQQAGKLPTIGFLGATPSFESQRVAAFVQRLRELAWVDGRNVAIEYRWAEGRPEHVSEIAAEFVRIRVDVIVTVGTPPTLAAKQATAIIPIVFASAGELDEIAECTLAAVELEAVSFDKIDRPGDVAARPRHARNEAAYERIHCKREYDRNRPSNVMNSRRFTRSPRPI